MLYRPVSGIFDAREIYGRTLKYKKTTQLIGLQTTRQKRVVADQIRLPKRGAVMNRVPDIDACEERAAIHEFECGLSRSKAEDLGAHAQGLINAAACWQWLADQVDI